MGDDINGRIPNLFDERYVEGLHSLLLLMLLSSEGTITISFKSNFKSFILKLFYKKIRKIFEIKKLYNRKVFIGYGKKIINWRN